MKFTPTVLFSFFILIDVLGSGQNNRCLVKVDGKYGYIDTLGKLAIAPKFDNAIQFSENYGAVRLHKKWGYVDSTGKIIIRPKYTFAERYEGGYACVVKNDKWGMIDLKGKVILPIKYGRVYNTKEGIVAVERDEMWAFFDLKKRVWICDFIYSEVGNFSKGLAKVEINKKWGMINSTGQMIIQAQYGQIMFDGLYCNRISTSSAKGGLWGYLNSVGDTIVDFKYDQASYFKENMAFVKENYWSDGYFIDTMGNQLFNSKFKLAWGFKDGLCGVQVGEKYGILNTRGEWVVQPELHWVNVFYSDGWIAFANRENGVSKWGVLNKKGEVIVEPQYTNIVKNDGNCILPEVYTENCAYPAGSHCLGYVNLKGEIIWHPTR